MRKPSVFVSSTCFDLKQVRTDIRVFLEGLGLEPLLSEFDTFPVSPQIGTVENCLKVVQERADIFVLIVDSRYGSVTEHNKSVTNLEFATGKAKGIPSYVFVARSILDVLPIWESNPEADFSKAADSPMLFQFVKDLKQAGDVWVFPFDTAQEIFSVLKTQFAYLFMDGLDLMQRARMFGGLPSKLLELRSPALRYVIERPLGWEYLLLGQVLRDGLDATADLKKDWEYGLASGAGRRLETFEFIQWMSEKIPEVLRMSQNLETTFNTALPDGIGAPGKAGNPISIVYAGQKVIEIYKHALEWKLDFIRSDVPDEVIKLRALVSGFCDSVVKEIEKHIRDFNELLPRVIADARAGVRRKHELTLRLTAPDLAEYHAELQRLQDRGLFQ